VKKEIIGEGGLLPQLKRLGVLLNIDSGEKQFLLVIIGFVRLVIKGVDI
jgi:hypothetical protein